MREAIYNIDGERLRKLIFKYFISNGNISMRDICRGTGLSLGSLYYWFDDKQNLVTEVTKYGFYKTVDKIFEYVFASVCDLDGFFGGILDYIDGFKNAIRFIYQIAANPEYSEKMREIALEVNYMYERLALKLAHKTGSTPDKLRPCVYAIASAVLDYAMWGDRQRAQCQLDFVYGIIKNLDN